MKKWAMTLVVAVVLFSVAPARAGGERISADGFFGCTNRIYFEQLITYVADKDMETFGQGLVAGVLAGQCVLFKISDEVFVTDTAMFSGLIRVRPKGGINEYWTNMEAVR